MVYSLIKHYKWTNIVYSDSFIIVFHAMKNSAVADQTPPHKGSLKNVARLFAKVISRF